MAQHCGHWSNWRVDAPFICRADGFICCSTWLSLASDSSETKVSVTFYFSCIFRESYDIQPILFLFLPPKINQIETAWNRQLSLSFELRAKMKITSHLLESWQNRTPTGEIGRPIETKKSKKISKKFVNVGESTTINFFLADNFLVFWPKTF